MSDKQTERPSPQAVVQSALSEAAISEWPAEDGRVCEVYLDVAADRIVERLRAAGLLADAS
ncbi:hypothetical protein ACFY05_32475 [Microtetraspora fusca]|uniref:Uncharacterized protein n=1 Tax=Microtetraspora fusca TaxID=1997 RepID=A0ABW6VE10_MICFU